MPQVLSEVHLGLRENFVDDGFGDPALPKHQDRSRRMKQPEETSVEERRCSTHLQVDVQQPGKLGLIRIFRTRFHHDAGGSVLCSATGAETSASAPALWVKPCRFLPDHALLLRHVRVLRGRPSQEAGGAPSPRAANTHEVARSHNVSGRVSRDLVRDHGFWANLLQDLWKPELVLAGFSRLGRQRGFDMRSG